MNEYILSWEDNDTITRFSFCTEIIKYHRKFEDHQYLVDKDAAHTSSNRDASVRSPTFNV